MSEILVLRLFRNYTHIACEFFVKRMTSTPATSCDMKNIWNCTVSVLADVTACQGTENTSWTRRLHFVKRANFSCICSEGFVYKINKSHHQASQSEGPANTTNAKTLDLRLSLLDPVNLTSPYQSTRCKNPWKLTSSNRLVFKTRLPPYRKYMLFVKMSPVVKSLPIKLLK